MNIKTNIILVLILILTVNIAANENPIQPESKTYALIVCGLIKDVTEEVSRAQVVSELQQFLIDKTAVTNETIEFIYPNIEAGQEPNLSTGEIIQQTISKHAEMITPNDNFIFFYIGQANIIGEQLRFNIPSPDITPEDIAPALNNIKAESMLIVLDCPCAAAAIKSFSIESPSEPNQPEVNRIIIGSSTSGQRYTTRFTSFFLTAYYKSESDTDMDNKISLLEAFTAASMGIDKWYLDNKIISTETPVLEDNGDGIPSENPWEYLSGGIDGQAASKYFLMINHEGI